MSDKSEQGNRIYRSWKDKQGKEAVKGREYFVTDETEGDYVIRDELGEQFRIPKGNKTETTTDDLGQDYDFVQESPIDENGSIKEGQRPQYGRYYFDTIEKINDIKSIRNRYRSKGLPVKKNSKRKQSCKPVSGGSNTAPPILQGPVAQGKSMKKKVKPKLAHEIVYELANNESGTDFTTKVDNLEHEPLDKFQKQAKKKYPKQVNVVELFIKDFTNTNLLKIFNTPNKIEKLFQKYVEVSKPKTGKKSIGTKTSKGKDRQILRNDLNRKLQQIHGEFDFDDITDNLTNENVRPMLDRMTQEQLNNQLRRINPIQDN